MRASRIPVSTPLITVPTTRPRSWSAASVAANGTSSWVTADVTPTTIMAAASTLKTGAIATTARATEHTSSIRQASARRSSRSPSGTSRASPIAKPICDAVTSSPAAASLTPRLDEIASSSGWA